MRKRLLSSFITLVLVALAVAGTVAALAWRPSLNPFQEETIDRTGSPVLQSLTDISEFHAATGHYETVVDIEKDTDWVPDWVSGERVLYVGKGDVDGIVDFSQLDERSVTTSEDGTTVTIELPAPTISEPVLNLQTSYVANHDQGIANRFKGSDLEREAQLRAIEQMTAAATGEDMLLDLTKDNTVAMLEGLLGALGYTEITVTFEDGAA